MKIGGCTKLVSLITPVTFVLRKNRLLTQKNRFFYRTSSVSKVVQKLMKNGIRVDISMLITIPVIVSAKNVF